MDETVCIPHAVTRMVEFYEHESCGKCTPCREGVRWLSRVLERIVHGHGREEDIPLMLDICGNIAGGKTLCALGEAAVNPVLSSLKLFQAEYEYHIRHGHCMAGSEALAH
jgi:NADH-quinone oxidoreductase subunit F